MVKEEETHVFTENEQILEQSLEQLLGIHR